MQVLKYKPRLKKFTFEEYLANDTLFEKNEATKRLPYRQNNDTSDLTNARTRQIYFEK